jgi:tryptophan synthase alpha chain
MKEARNLFSAKDQDILSIYFTAGFPALEDTGRIALALQNSGAGMLEIGMPYSDPLADGPVIQHSSMKALENGMTLPLLFGQLNKLAGTVHIPMILMGYLNPVLQYGFENFCRDAKEAGVSGVILPDLPMDEYELEYKSVLDTCGLHFIFLITPETSEERIRKIDAVSSGFIYAVSSSSITGRDQDMGAQKNYFERIRDMKLRNRVLIGFGIKDHSGFREACRYAAGGIIGTAYIRAIGDAPDLEKATADFLNAILQHGRPA